MASVPLNLANNPTHVVLDLGCTRSIGSRAAVKGSRNMRCIMALEQSFVPATSPLCLPTLRWRLAWKVVFIFQRNPPCSTRFDVLETGVVPILFSVSQMKILGFTVELDPKGDKIKCPAFGLYSSQLNTLLWDISSWILRVLRISQYHMSDPLTRRDM